MRTARRAPFDPDPDQPRTPSSADVGLAVGFAALAIAEAAIRDSLPFRLPSLATTLIVSATLAFRRVRPFTAHSVAFGLTIAAGLAAWSIGREAPGLMTHACILMLPFALVRWASRRAIAVGLALVAATYAVGVLQGEIASAEDVIGSAVVLLFPALLGATIRFRADAARRAVTESQLEERAELARELHDTVAHHVAAIAIQAQGARAVLASRPDAAAKAIAAIEDEATRALAELRILVGSLRDEAGLAPRATLDDLERLVVRSEGPTIAIERLGSLDDLAPTVEAAIVRVIQESITNARRHARNAMRIDVRIAREADSVHLTIRDDGDATVGRRPGFGLVGMAERAALLGGTLVAGPDRERGWTVDAMLPRNGALR